MTANRVSNFIFVYLHIMSTCVNSYHPMLLNLWGRKNAMQEQLHPIQTHQLRRVGHTSCLFNNKLIDCWILLKVTSFRDLNDEHLFGHTSPAAVLCPVISQLRQVSDVHYRLLHPSVLATHCFHENMFKKPQVLRNPWIAAHQLWPLPNIFTSNEIYNNDGKYQNESELAEKQRSSFNENVARNNSTTISSSSFDNGTELAGNLSKMAIIVTSIEISTESNILKSNEIKSKQQTHRNVFIEFLESLAKFERKFFELTFTKLSSVSPPNRRENGISFVLSGLFIQLFLLAISVDIDSDTRTEIEKCIEFSASNTEISETIMKVISMLPASSEDLKFRWTSRLILTTVNMSGDFRAGPASALQLHLDHINNKASPEVLMKNLNKMVEMDSKGAMRDTFDEDELTDGVHAVLLNTVYVRARWRSPPTLLNGTRPFHDANITDADSIHRTTRMIRINDIMRYADLKDWDAEAIEISYATPGLSLLLLVPRARSLRSLLARVTATDLSNITDRMHTKRLAVSLPLYTLRMTLILPSKLKAMGITRLVDVGNNNTDEKELRLSHAVQRIMFWSEAGRQAFKDDGIEWDDVPELELLLDRPYLFFVRWRNITLVNGNFVL